MSWPAISCRGLSRRFGEVVAVDRLDLEIEGPGLHGFLGANGAGKTTTLRMLVGLLRPSAGTIRLLGQDPDAPELRRLLGYLPQEPAFYPWMRGDEYVEHVAAIYGIERREARRRAGDLLERCGLGAKARRRRIGGYSGGMRQRLGIAQALVGDPRLLLLDEPVSALDPLGRAEVLELLRELGRDRAVFMSSHILADVERICPRVTILADGRLIADEATAELKARTHRPGLEALIRGDGEALRRRLEALPGVRLAELAAAAEGDPAGSQRLRISCDAPEVAEVEVPRALLDAGARLLALAPREPSLEEVFIHLVGARREDVPEDRT